MLELMTLWQRPSAVSLLATHLRSELEGGRWSGRMPGVIRLARELGAARKTVETALRELEREGLLVPQGHGRGRLICRNQDSGAAKGLRVAILCHDPLSISAGYIIELQHLLQEAGYTAFFSDKCLLDMKMDVKQVARMVQQTGADAWIVLGGSGGVLEWFVNHGAPAFALFGRWRNLPIAAAGPEKTGAFRQVVRRLVALGHRRIVLLALKARRLPQPGVPERAFLKELAAQGIETGAYHLPDWEESPEGLQELLESYFPISPPTAILVDEAYLFHAVKHHLAARGIRTPADVSLVCTDPDRTFAWCRPSIAHIDWDHRPILRRVLRWAENVAHGTQDLRQTLTTAVFVDGDTIGKRVRSQEASPRGR
jgi:DNA-binding LacI/PurR family transcriptional regulator